MTLQPSDVAAVVTWATAVSLVVAVVVGAAALLLVAAVVLEALVGGRNESRLAPGAPDISEPHPVTDTARAKLTIVGRILGKY